MSAPIKLPPRDYDGIISRNLGEDVSDLLVFTITNDSKTYKVVATTYDEALLIMRFEEAESTKVSEVAFEL
jgi:hypothetical protein